jgi:hypothetical protein
MVVFVAIATIGIGMANANRVLVDDSGGIQNHFGDNHEGDEHRDLYQSEDDDSEDDDN